MVDIITHYANQFARLNTDKKPKLYPDTVLGRAPHKPLLLLSVIDLFEQQEHSENHIKLTPDLVETFMTYWARVMPKDWQANIVLPFFHLQKDGFWHLIPQPGKSDILTHLPQIRSVNQLLEITQGASLDEELYTLVCQAEPRRILRAVLIKTYFSLEAQPNLWEQVNINAQAFEYSEILESAIPIQTLERLMEEKEYTGAARDQGFRRAIVMIYEHHCALCRSRILTNDGHSLVDAAHIKPWSIYRDDHPSNGIALCKSCHWAFDEGLLSVSKRYTVMLSRQLSDQTNSPGYLMSLKDEEIILPVEPSFKPALENLRWHWNNRFRRL